MVAADRLPATRIKLVELFAPQHSSEGLALYAPQVLVNDILLKVSIERVRLAQASLNTLSSSIREFERCSPALRRTRMTTLPRAGTVR